VGAAILGAGYRIVGVDVSGEVIDRARKRCAEFGESARFVNGSLFDGGIKALGRFDAAISRYVLHHVLNPSAFVARQADRLAPGGVLAACDHVTEPDPMSSAHHGAIETGRDRTHTRNLTGGQLVELVAALSEIRLVEEGFWLDSDERFDRIAPSKPNEVVRELSLCRPRIRSFRPSVQGDGSIRAPCLRAIVRA
jgi:SAM-dependent methyltransferase